MGKAMRIEVKQSKFLKKREETSNLKSRSEYVYFLNDYFPFNIT